MIGGRRLVFQTDPGEDHESARGHESLQSGRGDAGLRPDSDFDREPGENPFLVRDIRGNTPLNPNISNLQEMEKELIRLKLTECGGNKSRAAKKLGISRRTLYRKLHEYLIQ